MIDIEKLENLPKRMGFKKQVKVCDRGRYWKWSLNRSDDHKVGDYYSWTIIQRVLTKFYKQNVNDAYTYYCTLVPKYQQKFFWKQFEPKRRWRRITWYLDDNNCIQNDELLPKYKGPYTLQSIDYKVKWVPIIEDRIKNKYYPDEPEYDHYFQIPYYQRDQYKKVVVKGIEFSFATKEDPRYVRYFAELEQHKKAKRKAEKKARKEKKYVMLSDAQIIAKRENIVCHITHRIGEGPKRRIVWVDKRKKK